MLAFFFEGSAAVEPFPINGSWTEYGLAGLVIATLFGFLVYLINSHNAERKEWRTEIKEIHTRGTDAIDGLKEVTHELTVAIKELSWGKASK